MEDVKQVTKQLGEASPIDISKAAQSNWVKPAFKCLDLKEALGNIGHTGHDGGTPPNWKVS